MCVVWCEIVCAARYEDGLQVQRWIEKLNDAALAAETATTASKK